MQKNAVPDTSENLSFSNNYLDLYQMAKEWRKPNHKRKKSKKQLTIVEQVQEETAIQNAKEVTEALEELKRQGHQVDIQVCPRCKSPKLKESKAPAEICGRT